MAHMVKRYTKNPVGAHYGLGDWLLQRLTAVVMAAYTVFVFGCLAMGRPASHSDMQNMFSDPLIRISTMVFFLALLYHAWVGMRDILMDYIKPPGLRLALQMAVALALVAYLVWSASILWGARA
jgi:succinate dehydrogenase / fumarate reductase, membrane anchor subunit